MNTLVYHTGALGDFVTILPALSLWRSLNPQARISYLGNKAHGELGKAAGYFAETFDVDRSTWASLYFDTLSSETAAFVSSFDSGIVFADDDSPVLKHFQRLVGDLLHQPPFPGQDQHIVDYHLSLFPSWEREKGVRQPVVRVAPGHPPAGAGSPRIAVIAPGSGGVRKNWPLERFAQISGILQERKIAVRWILGPAESSVTAPPGVETIRGVPLEDLCRILSGADLYVGNDSGVSHLAAACGCRAVVLFGPSDPAVWRPKGGTVKLVSAITPCGPCHGKPDVEAACTTTCMEQIAVATVAREILGVLGWC